MYFGLLVQTAKLYSPGKYVHWKLNFFNGGPVLAIENYSSKSPMRPYTNCTGQIWYVHWFPSWKLCFGPNSIDVQSWEVCELEFDFFDCGSSFIKLWRFFKVTCAAVQELYRSNLVCTLIPILKGVFWSNIIAVQSLEVCALKIWFFQWRSCVSYREIFKFPCAAVHELYRSNLVCPLIPIFKGVLLSKQHSCTVLGSMCTENWIFSMEGMY